LKSEEKWFFGEMDIAEIRQWLTTNGFDREVMEELVNAEPILDAKGVSRFSVNVSIDSLN